MTVVCAIDSGKNVHLVIERIYADLEHSKRVLPKLQEFWKICILQEILGRWFQGGVMCLQVFQMTKVFAFG